MKDEELIVGNVYHFSNGTDEWVMGFNGIRDGCIQSINSLSIDSKHPYGSGAFTSIPHGYNIRPATYAEQCHWQACAEKNKWVEPKDVIVNEYQIY